jgi:hypothetical protein
MAIGGPNNPLANLFKNNSTAGLAPKNQTEQVSSTETKNTASESAGRIAQLRAEALGDVFGTVGADAVAKTAGASPIASSAIKFNENITATSALGKPSSVAAIDGPGVVAATTNDNAQLKLDTTRLASLANGSNARTVEGDFNVSAENTSLADNNTALAAARG